MMMMMPIDRRDLTPKPLDPSTPFDLEYEGEEE